MTIKVTIKHDQPDYPNSIGVQATDAAGKLMGPTQLLHSGDSAEFYVWSGQQLVVREIPTSAD